MKRFLNLSLLVVLVLSALLALPGNSAQAAPATQDSPWCGSAQMSPPNYGFDTHGYATTQTYWTVDQNNLVSEQAKKDADVVLTKLDKDQLAQTAILVLPENQVSDPVNCAVFFLRFMKLGLVSGPHADNGFVWLVIKHPASTEVRYGVGLGLNALTAPGLGDLKRVGVDAYASSGSVDTSVLELVKQYDAYVRQQYPVGQAPAAAAAPVKQTETQGLQLTALQCLCFLGIILLVLLFLATVGGSGGGGGGYSNGGYSSSDTSHSSSSHSSSSSSSSSSHSGSGSGQSNRGG